eukprot:14739085-Ditylum_brightwellii.AAC.1
MVSGTHYSSSLAHLLHHLENSNLHLHQQICDNPDRVINKEITTAYNTLKHSMFQSDQLLFTKTLENRLQTSIMAKTAWLEAVKIAVHNFQHIHKHSPEQRTITFFDNTSCGAS